MSSAGDTLGLVHGMLVRSAGVLDRTGGRLVLEQCRGRMPRLRRIWADGAYRGRLVRWVRRTRRWVLQIISPPAGSNAFVLLKWSGWRDYSGYGDDVDAYASVRSFETAVAVLEPRRESGP